MVKILELMIPTLSTIFIFLELLLYSSTQTILYTHLGMVARNSRSTTEVAALLKAPRIRVPNLLAASGYMLEQYQTRTITAIISNPDVVFGRYRTMMATAAATTRTNTVAAAPTRMASGVASTMGEAQESP